MKLIKLYANQKSFRTVTFNENVISLITARKKTNRNSDTYNSVGKSLMILETSVLPMKVVLVFN